MSASVGTAFHESVDSRALGSQHHQTLRHHPLVVQINDSVLQDQAKSTLIVFSAIISCTNDRSLVFRMTPQPPSRSSCDYGMLSLLAMDMPPVNTETFSEVDTTYTAVTSYVTPGLTTTFPASPLSGRDTTQYADSPSSLTRGIVMFGFEVTRGFASACYPSIFRKISSWDCKKHCIITYSRVLHSYSPGVYPAGYVANEAVPKNGTSYI